MAHFTQNMMIDCTAYYYVIVSSDKKHKGIRTEIYNYAISTRAVDPNDDIQQALSSTTICTGTIQKCKKFDLSHGLQGRVYELILQCCSDSQRDIIDDMFRKRGGVKAYQKHIQVDTRIDFEILETSDINCEASSVTDSNVGSVHSEDTVYKVVERLNFEQELKVEYENQLQAVKETYETLLRDVQAQHLSEVQRIKKKIKKLKEEKEELREELDENFNEELALIKEKHTILKKMEDQAEVFKQELASKTNAIQIIVDEYYKAKRQIKDLRDALAMNEVSAGNSDKEDE